MMHLWVYNVIPGPARQWGEEEVLVMSMSLWKYALLALLDVRPRKRAHLLVCHLFREGRM